MRTLHGKVVLITGAARGIGEHTARVLAARGARLALVGLEPERLERLAGELGPAHLWAACDVTHPTDLTAVAERAAAELGGIDVVVANAGIAGRGTVASASVDSLVRTIEVNLVGVVRTVHATLPMVLERRGHYLLISSAAAFLPMPGLADYAGSKAGVEQFGNALRLELAARGVTVGTAHPIWIDTDLVRAAEADLPAFSQALQRLPGVLGRKVSVEDCAEALAEGIRRRRSKVYVPRSIALFQALRTVINGPLGHRAIQRVNHVDIDALEQQLRRVIPAAAPAPPSDPPGSPGAPAA